MIYFDNEYLKLYLKDSKHLAVLVNKEYLDISDESDLESTTQGVGYNNFGEPQYFDYKAIEAIKINGFIYSRDELNQKFNPEAPSSSKEEPTKKDSKESPDEITIDPDKKKKAGKAESISKNDFIRNLDPKSPYYGTAGSVISSNGELVTYQTYVNNSFQKISCLVEHVKKET